MNFSSRTAWQMEENEFSGAVREARASGRELFDLTVSNPTACGFRYEAAELLAPLADAAALCYEPDALGTAPAREAVAAYYREHSVRIPIKQLCLTTSTSEAYSFLFRLLCDPGDEVLIAHPSYPLFDYIARLDDVRLRPYPLFYDPTTDPAGDESHTWSIDFHALEAEITAKTRAMIVVHPNNPTGNFTSSAERARLEQLCVERELALIVDEVFLDYALGERQPQSFLGPATGPRPLCFVLSGLSKISGLPQMKVSWIAATGPKAEVVEAMRRLEVIADTFLSMNAPAQLALPQWLGSRFNLQRQIRERVSANLAALDARLRNTSAQCLMLEGGWTTILRVPRTVGGQTFAYAALERGVVVQPGDFYGLPEGRIVLSLLTPPETWERGLPRLPIEHGLAQEGI